MSAVVANALEQAVLAASPLAAAPRYGHLSPLQPWQHRYVAAADGLYFQAATPHFEIVAPYAPIAESAHPLPYGNCVPDFTFIGGGLPGALFQELCRRAIERASTEGAWLVMDHLPEGLKLTAPTQVSAGSAHVQYSTQDYPAEHLVADVHSHGAFDAFFSATDDTSEDGAYVAIVFGKTLQLAELQVTARACFFGRTFPLDLAWEDNKLVFQPGGPCGASPQVYGVLDLMNGAKP